MDRVRLPLVAVVWFLAVVPIVIIDALFVLTRATVSSAAKNHPLAEMFPFSLWTIYAKYDRRYASNDDVFVVVQSWLNIVEVALGLLVVLLNMLGATTESVHLAIVVAVMTLYKTITYYAFDIAEKGLYTKHNPCVVRFLLVILPSLPWIIVPAVIVWKCFHALGPNGGRKTRAAERVHKKGN